MKIIVAIGEYLFLIWWFVFAILFFWIFVTAHLISEQKNEKNQSLIYPKNDLPPEKTDKHGIGEEDKYS